MPPRLAIILLSLGVCAPAAAKTPVSMGFGAGVSADVRDRASQDQTRLGAGPAVVIPLRIEALDFLRVRLDLRFEMGFGRDQLTWTAPVDGVPIRFTDDDAHRAFVGSLGVEAGFDVVVPARGRVRPYLAGSVGVAMVGAYHALDGGAAVLLDPEQNDVGNPRNIDPYTLQPALVASAGLGLTITASKRVDLWIETGYSGAFVGSRPLRKTLPELEARREAFAWNPIRAGFGFSVRL